MPEGLRGRERVVADDMRRVTQQGLLHRLAPHDTRGDQGDERRQLPPVGLGVHGPHHGLGEGVADDRHGVDRLGVDHVQHLDRVVVAARRDDDGAPGGQGHERGEPAGAVHERAGRQMSQAALVDHVADRGEVGLVDREGRVGGPDDALDQVVLPPHDALGHPGGAPGVEHQQVVARTWLPGAHRVAGRLGRVLVRGGPRRAGPGAVVDPEPGRDLGQLGRGSARSCRRRWRGR